MGSKKLGWLIDVLFDQQHVSLLGFDIVFAEPNDRSGFSRLSELARTEFKDQAGFSERLKQLQPELDYDAFFAKVLVTRPAVLGYYFTSENDARAVGTLPAPVESKKVNSRAGMGCRGILLDRLRCQYRYFGQCGARGWIRLTPHQTLMA